MPLTGTPIPRPLDPDEITPTNTWWYDVNNPIYEYEPEQDATLEGPPIQPSTINTIKNTWFWLTNRGYPIFRARLRRRIDDQVEAVLLLLILAFVYWIWSLVRKSRRPWDARIDVCPTCHGALESDTTPTPQSHGEIFEDRIPHPPIESPNTPQDSFSSPARSHSPTKRGTTNGKHDAQVSSWTRTVSRNIQAAETRNLATLLWLIATVSGYAFLCGRYSCKELMVSGGAVPVVKWQTWKISVGLFAGWTLLCYSVRRSIDHIYPQDVRPSSDMIVPSVHVHEEGHNWELSTHTYPPLAAHAETTRWPVRLLRTMADFVLPTNGDNVERRLLYQANSAFAQLVRKYEDCGEDDDSSICLDETHLYFDAGDPDDRDNEEKRGKILRTSDEGLIALQLSVELVYNAQEEDARKDDVQENTDLHTKTRSYLRKGTRKRGKKK